MACVRRLETWREGNRGGFKLAYIRLATCLQLACNYGSTLALLQYGAGLAPFTVANWPGPARMNRRDAKSAEADQFHPPERISLKGDWYAHPQLPGFLRALRISAVQVGVP